MKNTLKYALVALGVVGTGYVGYLIYTKINDARIDSKVVTENQADNLIDQMK